MHASTNDRPHATTLLLIAFTLGLAACSSDSSSADSGRPDTAVPTDTGTLDAADAQPADTGRPDTPDAGAADAGASDAASSGAPCSFNRDCVPSERCECDESTGCQCLIGARGTGRLGIDACQTGEDCASAVCLEGPNDDLVCSGPCENQSDCGGALPICADIAFVGRICIRDPNG